MRVCGRLDSTTIEGSRMSTHDTMSRSAGTPTAQAGTSSTRGLGSVVFALIILMAGGVSNFSYGIPAISDSKFFVNDTKYVFSNPRTWGWIALLVGVVGIAA